MLIVYRIAMALFIGFAPIFILCLLFKKTAPLFQKWLFYGLATIFSGVMLGVMSYIAMSLVLNLWGSAQVGNLIANIFTGSSTGIMQTVTQQLGLGLMLSTLLITVPPMAGLWFNGVMGNYSSFGPRNTLGTTQQQHLPPGMGGQQGIVEQKAFHHYQQLGQSQNTSVTDTRTLTPYTQSGYSNISGTRNDSPVETIKSINQAQYGAANLSQSKSTNSSAKNAENKETK